MNDESDTAPPAHVRPRGRMGWVWFVPLLAAVIVGTWAVRTLAERGPLISISFADAEGLEAGETSVRHKNVELGTVESISLSHDMSRAVVRVRMRRSASAHLNANTRFWIVRPRVGLEGVSGLSTLVSGAYIEMYPGGGAPARAFVGLAEPPVLTPDTPGRTFTLQSPTLGSLVAGSPISYRGIPVGEVQGYALGAAGTGLRIYAFIRSPYDRYVNAQSRFWNSGGVEVAIGADGVQLRAASWQELISGGVSFDTPDADLQAQPSPTGAEFRLYENDRDAQRDPRGDVVLYRVDLPEGSNDLRAGSGVELQGVEVGQVKDARLQYDDVTGSLHTRVTLAIDPTKLGIVPTSSYGPRDAATQLEAHLRTLVRRGLRAHLAAANLLTGTQVVALDITPEAPPGRIDREDGYARIPSTTSVGVAAVLARAQSTLAHLDTAVAGPQLKDAIAELDLTLRHLEHISAAAEPQVQPLLQSLRETSSAAQHTLQAADGVLGHSAESGTDLPRLMRELTQAASSLRDLTSYLQRHPEALIRGRGAERP